MRQTGFLKLAAFAAFATVLTTLGIHFVEFQADTFQERLRFAHDPAYLAQKWMIILHCLLVIVSMFGVAEIAGHRHRGLAALGALFIAVFGVAEITRMLGVLAYLNPLKDKYLAAQEEIAHQVIQLQIESFGLAASVLFLVFILAFALGNFFIGWALASQSGKDRWLGWVLMLWGLLTLLAFANYFWENSLIDSIVGLNGKFLQPLIRLAIGVWLTLKVRSGEIFPRPAR